MGDLLKNTFATITQSTGDSSGEDQIIAAASSGRGNTVLSISICNTTSTDGEFTLSLNARPLYYKQPVSAGATFIINSRITLAPTDVLNCVEPNNDGSQFDVVVSYMEQTA